MRMRNISLFVGTMLVSALAGSLDRPETGPRCRSRNYRAAARCHHAPPGSKRHANPNDSGPHRPENPHRAVLRFCQQAQLHHVLASKNPSRTFRPTPARVSTPCPLQVQGLSDNLEEIKSRIGKLNQQLVDLQNSVQSIDSRLAGGAPTSTPAGSSAPSGRPGSASNGAAPMSAPAGPTSLRRHSLLQRPPRSHQRQIRSRPLRISGLSQVLRRHRPRLQRPVLARRNRLRAEKL